MLGLPLLIGCLPVELSTSEDGVFVIPRQEGFFLFDPADASAQRLTAADSGQPALALFAPDDRRVLLVTSTAGTMMGAQSAIRILTLEGGALQTVAEASNMGYVQWGPQGRQISYARVGDSAREPLEENMPELHWVDLESGADQVLAHNVGSQHRWFPDGERLLIFRVLSKQGDQFIGQLVALKPGGEEEILVSARGSGTVMDIAPDGNRLLFTANAAAKPGQELEGASTEVALYGYDLTTQALAKLAPGVKFGFFSPDGKRILSGREADEKLLLEVRNAAGGEPLAVADDGVSEAGPMMQSTPVYPGWLDAERIYYLAQHAVYGVAAKNLALTVVSLNDQARRNLQPAIDAAIEAAAVAQ